MTEPLSRNTTGQGHEYELLVEAVEDYAIFLLSPEGIVASWNRGAERLFGFTASEAVGKHFSIFYPPAIRDEKPAEELRVARRDGHVEEEGWRLRKGAGQFWANTVLTAVHTHQGELLGFAKITRDLTQRKAQEEELRRAAEVFRLLMSSVREYAIFMLDPQGYIVNWNAGAERIKGYSADEVVGKHFSIFYTPEDVADGQPQRMLQTARTKGKAEAEAIRVRKDGSRFWADVVLTAIFDDSGELRGFAKVTRDITERREAEETRRALLEQREARLVAEENRRRAEGAFRDAQEANRAKDQFLMVLSHELRTPMTAILGWTKLLESASPGDPLFREGVDAIVRAAKHQASLVEDVLDLSKIASGKLRLDVGVVDLEELLRSVISTVRPSADAKEIELVIGADRAGTVTGDATRLRQVIWNLLSNAVKFTPHGGRVRLSAKRDESSVQVSVTDTGQGIDPSFLPHVFEPFRQAESASTRSSGGLGLGLSIVRYIVEAHGGTIVAESAGTGRGATFTLTLPVPAVSIVDGDPTAEPADARAKKPLAGITTMIVEDDPETRRLLTVVLQRSGAKVLAAGSAAEARSVLVTSNPDIVMTDISMPEEDGFQVLRDVRSKANRVPVIALTALGVLQRDRAIAEGFTEYLAKPIEPFTLVDTVVRVLRSRGEGSVQDVANSIS